MEGYRVEVWRIRHRSPEVGTEARPVTSETILPRRAKPQPQPHIESGGDCGACVLSGLTGLSIEDTYDLLLKEGSPSRFEMIEALNFAQSEGLVDRIIEGVPLWSTRDVYLAFGASGYLNAREWFQYLRMAAEAGYYGIASVVFDKTGAEGKIPPETDHVVLLCGARERLVPHETMKGAGCYDLEVLVSCSAKSSPDEEWVEVTSFLTNRGGYNATLVRPV